jgi:hypothetical protein
MAKPYDKKGAYGPFFVLKKLNFITKDSHNMHDAF